MIGWAVFLITVATLAIIFVPRQPVLSLGLAAGSILIKVLSNRLQKKWIRHVVDFILLAAIITAGLVDANRTLLYLSIIGLVIVWNLDFLTDVYRNDYEIRDETGLMRRYLATVALLSLAALVFMVLSSSVQLEFGFGVILVLGILLIFSLSRLLGVRRENTKP